MHPVDLAAAVALDVLLGDPEWLPHPVRQIGRLLSGLESLTRRLWRNERVAGTVTILAALAVTAGVVWGTLAAARLAGETAERVVGVIWVYLGLSARCLSDEARRVYRCLTACDLPAARNAVGRIVGRDTAALDESGVSRAAIESVAENTVDGILTPLFFAAIGGPVGLWVFKAMSTADSMIGHKDARYIRFGTVAARLDDAANFIPARFSAGLFAVAAAVAGKSARDAWRVAWRDRHHHDSPNSGIPEAAMAGALRVRLGGPVQYGGERVEHHPFGEEFRAPGRADVRSAIVVMWWVTLAGAALALAAAAWMQWILA